MPSIHFLVFIASLIALLVAILYSSPLQQHLTPHLPSFKSARGPRVRIPQGVIIGTTLGNGIYPAPVEAFLGIPYAEPPIGDRRFRRLEPLLESKKTFKALNFGPICPGKQLLATGDNSWSEDCLSVNIFRQKGPNDRKLPVAVYIHGGAFNRGSAKMHNTASMVAWSEEPFIGVSFNYRLGALGFLPSKVTFDEGIVNLGLRDQAFLLQWVHDNIEAFGGDKDDVTIIGLSAGAHSVGHHILNYNPFIAPLFHKAVLESGSPTSRAVHIYDAPLHEEQFSLFVSEAGCADVSSSQITTCLRTKPSETIVNASITVFNKYNPSIRWAFQPVIDHDLIVRRPIDTWSSGEWHRVPILTGHNTNEGTMYVPSNMATSQEFVFFFHTLLPHYDIQDLDEINALYPDPFKGDPKYHETRDMTALSIGPQFKRVEAAYAHYAYTCPVGQTANEVSSVTSNPSPVWVYHWALNKTVKGGANHADNMYYESFQDSVTSISPAQKEVSGLLHAYLTSFITTGDPNAVKGRYEQRPLWESYVKGENERVMTFGMGNDERAGGSSLGVPAEMRGSEWIEEECEFWWRKSTHTEEMP